MVDFTQRNLVQITPAKSASKASQKQSRATEQSTNSLGPELEHTVSPGALLEPLIAVGNTQHLLKT